MSLSFVRPFSKFIFLAILALVLVGAPGCKKKTPEEKFDEAQQLLGENQVSLAVLKMKDLIKESPDAEVIPDVRMALAQVYVRLGGDGNFDKVIEQLEIVGSELGMNDERGVFTRNMIPNLYMQKGELNTALAEAEKNVELAEGNDVIQKEMMIALGNYQLLSEDEAIRNKAIETFTKLMLEDEKPVVRGQSREILAKYYRDLEEFEQSNEIYDQYMEKYPDDTIKPMLQMMQGANFAKIGEAGKAKIVFDEGYEAMAAEIEEELDGQTRNIKLNQLASLSREYGDMERAMGNYEQIMAENPMTQEAINAQMNIGELFVRFEKWDEAIAHFEQMAKENPNSQIATNSLMKVGGIYIRAEKFDEAISYYEKLAQDNPNTQLGEAASKYLGGIKQLQEQLALAAEEAAKAVDTEEVEAEVEDATDAVNATLSEKVEEVNEETNEILEESTEKLDVELPKTDLLKSKL